MAQEIEEYLLKKLSTGLETSKIRCCNKLFQELTKLLKKKLESPSSSMSILREKLYYLNNLLTECQTLSRKRSLYTPDELYALYNIRRNLKKIKDELSLKPPNEAPNGSPIPDQNNDTSISNQGQVSRSSSLLVHASSKIYGFEDELISIGTLLRERGNNEAFKAVGVVGMSGVGKSTLCRELMNREDVKSQFLPRIWVSLSKKENEAGDTKTALVKRMLDSLGVEEDIIQSIFNEHAVAGLLCALYQQLRGKRYLIVFDDAMDTDLWYSQLNSSLTREGKWDARLGYGLPKGRGAAVIVTSRKEGVVKMMVGEENLHRLQPRSDPESCWSIFIDSVRSDGLIFNPSNVEDLKKEIVNKCGGLPLAAKMMGQIMNEQLQEKANGSVINQGT
ncbi:hypothetical protein HS088_TW21G01132 [Tripterygium wilfordii]|uniref:NB-ARC domain-containing protein n=1 Tax=Tripterygium wilfordii TaxID=458696 RepID=A0A7J7C4W6_TRIWF|nr:hypothetical protein HS088_TW21G01132 [Tripterygium wilfordii]